MITDAGKIEAGLRAEFRSLAIARDALPMLTSWGVEDFSQTIHSLGCNYLTAIGRASGFWAMSEYPIRIGPIGASRSIRPDVAWWERSQRDVVLLGEFERAEPRNSDKLVDKARNLLQAHHALGERPRVLVLLAWALAGTNLGDMAAARSVMASGFRTAEGAPVRGLGPDARFVLATAVFAEADGHRRLTEVFQ